MDYSKQKYKFTFFIQNNENKENIILFCLHTKWFNQLLIEESIADDEANLMIGLAL
jgi:hypothetical protein